MLVIVTLKVSKMLFCRFRTKAKESRRNFDAVRIQLHDFKHFLSCTENVSVDQAADVRRQIVNAQLSVNINFKVLLKVNENNISKKVWVMEGGNILGKTFWGATFSDDFPAVF